MSAGEKGRGSSLRTRNRHRRARRGDVLVILLILLAIAAILAAMLLPALARARQQARRTACMAGLRQIGLALTMYANDNAGHFPDALEQLAADGRYISDKLLYCPSRKKRVAGELDYVYVEGLSLSSIKSPQNQPIVFDKKGNHPGGRNVLFVDLHVEWLKEPDFQKRYGHLDRAR